MKKFLNHLMVLLLMAVSVAIPTLTLSSCHEFSKSEDTSKDSVNFQQMYESAVCPVFNNTGEMVAYHDVYVSRYTEDSIFRSLPSSTIENISKVLIYKTGVVSKKTVVDEYLRSEDIYNAIYSANNTEEYSSLSKDDTPPNSKVSDKEIETIVKEVMSEGGSGNE